MSKLVDQHGNPLVGSSFPRDSLGARGMAAIRSVASSRMGTLADFYPKRDSSQWNEGTNRTLAADRAEWLTINEGQGESVIHTASVNVVGSGLYPQSMPEKESGLTKAESKEFADSAEYVFEQWATMAGADGRLNWDEIQEVAFRSVLIYGDYFHACPMLDDPTRIISLAISPIHPQRVKTPPALQGKENIRDGILFDGQGRQEYFYTHVGNNEFVPIRHRAGHRITCFHGFRTLRPEQQRGDSILGPVLKTFMDSSDYVAYELIGAMIAASLTAFIEQEMGGWNNNNMPDPDGNIAGAAKEAQPYKRIEAGQIIFGAAGEKPHILESKRPGPAFDSFVEKLDRRIAAATGQTYESITMDFSKTNYSSARAALAEAWRFYSVWHSWFVKTYCHKVWEMVIEEAYLRGLLALPKRIDFYAVRHALLAARWSRPPRGYIDPLKEAAASIQKVANNQGTLADIYHEQGKDWEEELEQRAREEKKKKELGLADAGLKSSKEMSESDKEGGGDNADEKEQN